MVPINKARLLKEACSGVLSRPLRFLRVKNSVSGMHRAYFTFEDQDGQTHTFEDVIDDDELVHAVGQLARGGRS